MAKKPGELEKSVWYMIDRTGRHTLTEAKSDKTAMKEAQEQADRWGWYPALIVRMDQYNVGEVSGKSRKVATNKGLRDSCGSERSRTCKAPSSD